MKKCIIAPGCLALFSFYLLAQEPAGVLKSPFGEPTSPKPEVKAPTAQSLFVSPKDNAPFSLESANDPYRPVLEKLKPNPHLAINTDIEIQPAAGPWVILITSYQGPEAPQLARQMVAYLRKDYQLHAYTFNYGTEEKRKEYERVLREKENFQAMVAKQKEALGGLDVAPMHRAVRYLRVEEQVGVLVGGYREEAAAKRGLDELRKLKPPDPNRVKLAMIYGGERDPKDPGNLKVDNVEIKYVNPFRTAFVARNPTVKTEHVAQDNGLDVNVLRRLNADEPFSLLQCKKPYTLAIKQYAVPVQVHGQNEKPSVLEIVGLQKGERVDSAAQTAHNLAEGLRKGKWDSYVLHTRFASVVTIGNFDAIDDAAMRSMKNLIQTRLKLPEIIQPFPQPLLMEVPGVQAAATARKN